MFKCPECKNGTCLPTCSHCGYEFPSVNGIYRMTDSPNMNLDENAGVRYIGYDKVGCYLDGKEWIECDGKTMKIGEEIARMTAGGVFLDLGCGSGAFTVPAVLNGCSVIAGDISTTMLELLLKKAIHNGADLSKITPCRMNALDIPLQDDSVDVAMVNSVLHLISSPEKVIDEVYRVLKLRGKLILGVNSPSVERTVSREMRELNKRYEDGINHCYKVYWDKLTLRGIRPVKHSWKFDQYAACKEKFGNMSEVRIDFYEKKKYKISDWFLFRMGGKGFSDQQGVDDDIHRQVFEETLNEMEAQYGREFYDIESMEITDGLSLRVFEK